MKRRFRLTRSTDFKRVRRSGKSYAHPLVVLYVERSAGKGFHAGVSAGRAVGNAVARNRAKRLIRAAMSELIPALPADADILLIARSRLAQADLSQTRAALSSLLERAGLLAINHDGPKSIERIPQ